MSSRKTPNSTWNSTINRTSVGLDNLRPEKPALASVAVCQSFEAARSGCLQWGAMTSPVPKVAIQAGSPTLEFNSYRLSDEDTAVTSWKETNEVWSVPQAIAPVASPAASPGSPLRRADSVPARKLRRLSHDGRTQHSRPQVKDGATGGRLEARPLRGRSKPAELFQYNLPSGS